jgi:CheY-like chemotaxis protein
VSDTGHGIDPAIIERVFDPYFTTKGLGEGTGLGLSVVQGIIKSHGGKITVHSEMGKGTTFYIFLPRLVEAAPQEVKTAEQARAGNERILFVDDEEALVSLGKEMLESLGYRITALTSSRNALEVFRTSPDGFDLVITDMTMPELTGRDLSRKIMSVRADIPIILCTGFSTQINAEQAVAAGIREFLMKPYGFSALTETIRKVLDRTRSTPPSRVVTH